MKKPSSTQLSPLLYDLTSLQRDANGRFGFSAKSTPGLAQALYEKHGAVDASTDRCPCATRGLPEYVNSTLAMLTGEGVGKGHDEALIAHYSPFAHQFGSALGHSE